MRAALEEALGLKFEGDKGEHFFRSTLVQTLFYGIFAAWVLWDKDNARTDRRARFEWREAHWHLHVPMIRGLFQQLASPQQLGPLGLVEVLDWAGEALNRVDRPSFFERFDAGQAVQYFYEPFLQAFDPELRKELGVWYTPPEIVQYMVARVDSVLRSELGLADGLADPSVYVLDPCCGTGAYLVEVLKRIRQTLQEKGGDALVAQDLKAAAMDHVFGFELLPAPFVIAHLQLGLLLQNLGAPLADEGGERAGVFLTNALTGWEPPEGPKQHLPFIELEQERDAAERVKREVPILVILGNPPYNGFAGVAVDEERGLTDAYRTTRAAPRPQGQGLNDLYVRFFRMAERRIVEKTGRGVICLISNYSWLDGLSYTGMRKRYLEAFDRIWIDCLNGDKYKTGKLTPEGQPDPSIFSTEANREGIQIGTAVALLVAAEPSGRAGGVQFRHLWGRTKRTELLETASQDSSSLYQMVVPTLEAGLAFMPGEVSRSYFSWPLLSDVFTLLLQGLKTSRDDTVIDIDRTRLDARMRQYFDPAVSHAEMARIAPGSMKRARRFDAEASRDYLRRRGYLRRNIFRCCYRPFDMRWVYWEPETKLLDEKREDLFSVFRMGTIFMTTRQKAERDREGSPFLVTRYLPDYHLTRPGSVLAPMRKPDAASAGGPALLHAGPSSNLSPAARAYLASLGIPDPDVDAKAAELVWLHVLAVGYSPAYLQGNTDGLRQNWPRVALPNTRDALLASAELGKQIAALLDVENGVPGVTQGNIRRELRGIGVASRIGSGNLQPAELAVTAGWGHAGKGGVTMPGAGKSEIRPYSADEAAAIAAGAEALGLTVEEARACLGETTRDIYLNGVAYWRNVPEKVWGYTVGGYQVMKKWLSYREADLLGRPLTPDEVREVTSMARRLAAILLLEPELDRNYRRCAENAYAWPAEGG